MVTIIDFIAGRLDCEVCKKAKRTPAGKMQFAGKRAVIEPEEGHQRFWRLVEYELKCDKCGAVMNSAAASPRFNMADGSMLGSHF